MIEYLANLIFDDMVTNKIKTSFSKGKEFLKDSLLNEYEKETLNVVLKDATEEDLKDIMSLKKYLESKLDLKKFEPKIKMRFNKPNNFIGREEELKELKDLVEINSKPILINGLGGIGKTTFAKAFFYENLGEYENTIWLDYQESLENTIFTFPHLEKIIDTRVENPKVCFQNFIYELGELRGENLLVIDNVNDIDDLRIIENIFPDNWVVLITSRGNIDEFNIFDLDVLTNEKARELFLLYYTFDKDVVKINNILKEIDNHTLLIELISKTAEKGRVYLEELLIKVKEYGYQISKEIMVKVSSEHSKKSPEFVHAYIEKIYDTTDLNQAEIQLLTNFVLLPTININIDLFLDLYQENKYETIETLENLNDKGWIKKIDENSYFLHQSLQKVLNEKLKPSIDSCKKIINSIIDLTSYKPLSNPFEINYYSVFSETILKRLKKDNLEEILLLNRNISYLNKETGSLELSFKYMKKAMEIANKIYDDEYNDIFAALYGELALIHKDNGELEDALTYTLKHLNIAKELYGEKNQKLGIVYGNLASIYHDLGDLDKAILYSYKDIDIEKIYATRGESIQLATAYSNLALIYQNKKEYKKALKYLLKGLTLEKNFYQDEKHPNIATSYGNLALLYLDLGELNNALEYQLISLQIKEELYASQNHQNLAVAYGSLSHIYDSLNNLDKALYYGLKCVAMEEELFETKIHPNLMSSYYNLVGIYFKLKDKEKLKEFLEKSYFIYKTIYPGGNSIYIGIEKNYKNVFERG